MEQAQRAVHGSAVTQAYFTPRNIAHNRSINQIEANILAGAIARRRPKSVLEIGTASGLSAVVMCEALAEVGGAAFTTVDLTRKFIGDRTKATGYLLDQHVAQVGGVVDVQKHLGQMSSFAEEVASQRPAFGMAFIDANHQHPWPLIDTLAIMPFCENNAVIFHHDLDLFKRQDPPMGIGPRYLFDALPDSGKNHQRHQKNSIFSLERARVTEDALLHLVESFLIPWTLKDRLKVEVFVQYHELFKRHYPSFVAQHFAMGYERHVNAVST